MTLTQWSTDDELTSARLNELVDSVNNFATVIDGTYTSNFEVGPLTSRLAVGGTISTGEKGLQIGYASNSSGGAVTLTSRNSTATYPLHLNLVEAGADPTARPVVIGARLPGYNTTTAIKYPFAVTYNNSETQWGGILCDGETTDVTGTNESTGADVNIFKGNLTIQTAGSWARGRTFESYAIRGNGSASLNIAPTRAYDGNVVIASNLSAGTKPWHYSAFCAMSRNYSFTARQANAAFYAGGLVGSPATTKGWAYGFYHDLADVDPAATPDPAFYTDANGDAFIKRYLGIGVAGTERIQVRETTSGTATRIFADHTQTTLGSDVEFWARVGAGSGNPALRLGIASVLDWYVLVDNAASDAFKIKKDSTTYLSIAASDGSISLGGSGGTLGFYGATGAAKASAYTQTYSTADRTHAAFTSADLTGISSSTTGSALAEPDAAYVQATWQQNMRRIQDQFVALRADVADAKQLINSVIDDLQGVNLVG